MLATVVGVSLLLAPAPIRERIRFDANWRFLRGAETTSSLGNGPFTWEYKLASYRRLDLTALPADLDAGTWKPTQLGINTLDEREKFAWYRTTIPNDPKGAEKVLEFESVDDNALVFLNGKLLKKHVGFGIPFKVPVASAWRNGGPNRLDILIENTAAGGGINGGIDFVLPKDEVVPDMLKPEFDDSKWRTVHLPHDYVVEGTFDPRGDVSHGSLPKPLGYYRKTFTPAATMRGKSVTLEFDGVYRNASFYLNGKKLGDHSSGYIGVRFDITKELQFGRPNVLSIQVDPRQNEGWWYEGGGIYRHVWLNVTDPVHVAPNGVYAKVVNPTKALARVALSTTVDNTSPSMVQATLKSEVLDPKGQIVATSTSLTPIAPNANAEVTREVTIDNPLFWDITAPNLYQVRTTVMLDGKAVDQTTTNFGVRTIQWDKNRGFLLNGRVVKLQGTCNHLDHAGVGTAMPDSLQEWRLRKLMEMGSNAYRCSHNPTSPEFMDMCDRLGMLVLDETRHLGDTTLPKTPTGTTADDLSELRELVLRDRNHPSVIGWSLYNEEALQATDEGAEIFKKMRAVVDKYDGTRVSTGANNYGHDSGIRLITDLYGYNYSIYHYDKGREKYSSVPIFGSETASTVSTRGIYANDTEKGYVSAYDLNYPSWAMTAEGAWRPIAERPWFAGGFVWTGFDYKGEPTPYGWPCINSHFGILDIAGFPKDNFYYYQAWWSTKPVVHVFPHWNWAGKEGQPIDVWVHSNADQVELKLNGKSLGTKDVKKLSHVEWKVPYTPGKLEAIGYKAGKVMARDAVETTGAPAAIRLRTDRTKIWADSEDVSLVQVEVVDAKGRVVPIASNELKFAVEGAGVVGGVGNGDPSDHDPDKADHRKAFNGLAMVLVQSNGKSGDITLRVTSPGLQSARLSLRASGGVVSQ